MNNPPKEWNPVKNYRSAAHLAMRQWGEGIELASAEPINEIFKRRDQVRLATFYPKVGIVMVEFDGGGVTVNCDVMESLSSRMPHTQENGFAMLCGGGDYNLGMTASAFVALGGTLPIDVRRQESSQRSR